MRQLIIDLILLIFRKKIIIISADYVGLGNRIKQLASYHICYGLDSTILVWSMKGWVDEKFETLFRFTNIQNTFYINIKFLLGIVTSYPFKKEFYERGFWRLFVSENDLGSEFLISRDSLIYSSIDFKFNNIPYNLLNRYNEFFNKLLPSKIVEERMKSIDIDRDFVCVFVRNSKNSNDKANVPEIMDFFKALLMYPKETKFFLSCLDHSIAFQFHQAFKNQIFELPNKNYKSQVDAVADLYLLGKGRELIISSGSTFCEVAWWLGGAKQPVVQVKTSYRQG